jgi:hypothetical protein
VTILSFLKLVALVVGIVTILGIAYSLIFLRNPERREQFQRRIEAVASSERIGEGFGKMVVAMLLFPVFIIVFMQPFHLLTIGLYYVLPKTNAVTKMLSASAWIGFVLAVVCAFLVCRWLWTSMTPKSST